MKLLNENEAAYYLGIPPGSLRELRFAGEIPAAQVTLRRAMYEVADLDAFVERTSPKHPQRTRTINGQPITIVYDE